MITKFLSSLNDLQKKLLVAAAIVVLIALFVSLFVHPTASKLSSIDNEIIKEEEQIKEDLGFLSERDKVIAQQKALEVYITKNITTDEEMIAAFLKQLEGIANKNKVSLAKVNPGQGVQEKNFIKYQADLECTGTLADVVAFMHAVDNDKELLKVVKFSLGGKKGEGDEIKATMTISKIIVADKDLPLKQAAVAAPADADADAK